MQFKKARLFAGFFNAFIGILFYLFLFFYNYHNPDLSYSVYFIILTLLGVFIVGFVYSYRGVCAAYPSHINHPIAVGFFSTWLCMIASVIAITVYNAFTPCPECNSFIGSMIGVFIAFLIGGCIYAFFLSPFGCLLGWLAAWLYRIIFKQKVSS